MVVLSKLIENCKKKRGQELGNSGEATNVPTQRLAESLLLLPPSPKRSNDNCYSPEQFSNRYARRKRLNATYFYFNFFSNCFSVAPVSESKRRSKVKAKFYEKLKRKCEVFVWVISFGIHQEFEKSDMGWWGWCLKKREIDFSFRDISSATKRNVSSA